MQVIATWSGARADLLRQAFRMSNESFAEHLTVSVRTVANWRGNPDVIPRPAIQDLLDAALERAPDRVKAQFALLVGEAEASNQEAGHLGSFETSLSPTSGPDIEGSELLDSPLALVSRHSNYLPSTVDTPPPTEFWLLGPLAAFGHTAALNAASCCTSVNTIPAGQWESCPGNLWRL
jgi:transcriptional regulator with XRE-family HTH domain